MGQQFAPNASQVDLFGLLLSANVPVGALITIQTVNITAGQS